MDMRSMLLRSLYVYVCCVDLKEMVPRVLIMPGIVFCECEM